MYIGGNIIKNAKAVAVPCLRAKPGGGSGMIYDYRFTEFEQEIPAELAQALEAAGCMSR